MAGDLRHFRNHPPVHHADGFGSHPEEDAGYQQAQPQAGRTSGCRLHAGAGCGVKYFQPVDYDQP
jgi:hypothetical protein